jgi:hypothetical protein
MYFVLFYVLFVCVVPCIVCVYICTVLLPPGGYPIAVNKYIILYIPGWVDISRQNVSNRLWTLLKIAFDMHLS